MNIAELISGGSSHESEERSSVESEGGGAGGRRGLTYQQRTAPLGSAADRRALRASEAQESRKRNKEANILQRRAINSDEKLDENEENEDTNAGSTSVQQKTRREKLLEFQAKKQKAKEEELKKKKAKPAFKAGLVHHPLVPKHLAAANSKSANSTINRGPASLPARNTTIKSSTLRKKTTRVLTKTSTAAAKAKSKAIPAVAIQPPSSGSSASSTGSTGSITAKSFAPKNFKFSMDLAASTPLETGNPVQVSSPSLAAIPKLRNFSENSEMSSDDVFVQEKEETIIPKTRRSIRSSTNSSANHDVEDNSANTGTEPSSSANESTALAAATNESTEPTPEKPNTSEKEVAIADPTKKSDEKLELAKPETSESDGTNLSPPRGRGRTRSRRFSGIQPDPTIPQEELAKTPARRVKERSASATRRSKVEWCPCCEDGVHDPSATTPGRVGTPIRTPRAASASKTPRGTSRVSRKSVLPMLSESSPSQDEEAKKVQVNPATDSRRKSRRMSKSQVDALDSDAEKDEVTSKVKRGRPRKSTKFSPAKLEREDENTDSLAKKSRRSRKSSMATTPLTKTPLPDSPIPLAATPRTNAPLPETLGSVTKEVLTSMDLGDNTVLDEFVSDTSLIVNLPAAAAVVSVDAAVKPLTKPRTVFTATTTSVSQEIQFQELNVRTRRSGRFPLVSQEAMDAPLPQTPAPANMFNAGLPGTPERKGELDSSVFKTPLPATASKKAKSAAKSRRTPGAAASPWIDQRRSNKRKYSLSETKSKTSIHTMFDDIPDSSSPIHDILAKKFRSSDNIDEKEVESILQQFKAQRLSETFDNIATENDQGVGGGSGIPLPQVLSLQLSPYKGIGMENELTPNKALKVATPRSHSKIATPIKPAGSEDVEVVAHAKAVEGQEESQHDVAYFRNLLVSETTRITKMCDSWEKKIIPEIPDDVQGQIRSVVGQGRLVMAQRFHQFSGLVDNCEFGTGEKTTSCMDLQGFWEMIFFQVEDVEKKFSELSALEQNQWMEVEVAPKKVAKKKLVVSKKPTARKPAVSGLRAHILAKKKAAESGSEASLPIPTINEPKKPSIKDMIAAKRAALTQKKEADTLPTTSPELLLPQQTNEDAEKSFDGGFFSITSPARPGTSMSEDAPVMSPAVNFSPRSSKSTGGDRLRRAVLTDSARRVSGLVSPYISAMAKRSIDTSRENSPVKDTRRSSLFDDLEDEETAADKETTDKKTEEGEEGVSVISPTKKVFDPVVPMASPVTKTYGSRTDHSKHEQLVDHAFDLLVSSEEERDLDMDSLKPAMKSGGSKQKGRQSVKFTGSELQTENLSASAATTPHPKSRRSRMSNAENISPNVGLSSAMEVEDESSTSPKLRNSRVSLLPGLNADSKMTSSVPMTSPPENLMGFSPATPTTAPTTRRSTRMSTSK